MANQMSGSPKKKKSKKSTPKKIQGRVGDEIAPEPKEHFDFGGLPIRDLKKNLGCG